MANATIRNISKNIKGGLALRGRCAQDQSNLFVLDPGGAFMAAYSSLPYSRDNIIIHYLPGTATTN